MQSDRLILNNIDLSTTVDVETSSPVLGFTIVNAPMGPSNPVLVSSGAELKSIFGTSSSEYPEMYEVETFVGGGYPCYVANSNVGTDAKVPCIIVTDNGYFMVKDVVYTSNGIPVMPENVVYYKYIPAYLSTYKKSNVDTQCIRFDKDSIPEAGKNSTGISSSVTFDIYVNNNGFLDKRSTGSTSTNNINIDRSDTSEDFKATSLGDAFNQADVEAFTSLDNITFYIQVASTEVGTPIAYIMPQNPSSYPMTEFDISLVSESLISNPSNINKRDILSISTVKYTSTGVSVGKTGNVVGTIGLEKSEDGSLKQFDESNNDYESQNGFKIVMTNNKFVTPVVSNALNNVHIICGESTLGTPSTKNWSLANDSEYDNVDLFFDPSYCEYPTTLSSDGFFGLAKTHNLAGFIFNYTVPVDKVNNASVLTKGPNYWNICGKVKVRTNTGYLYSSLVGAKTLLQAQIIENYNGGSAPMFTTGVLDVPYTQLTYRYSKSQLTALDKKNFNPVMTDSVYGLMVTSQKTCKGGATTDWSYIGHVSAFLNFEKEVYNTVMIPQIGKPNNPYYRELRKQEVETILEKRLTTNRIWAEGVVDTSTAEGVNDDINRKARKFVISVKVKVDIFSEYVVLNFTNVDQSTVIA